MSSLNSQPEYWTKLYQLLSMKLGKPETLHRSSPLSCCQSSLEILVATILTQATSDRNALRAWLNFKAKYAGFEDVIASGTDVLSDTIRPAGMAAQRSKTIIGVLQNVRRHFGAYSLEGLANDPDTAWDFLTGLPGVGSKTAACTMLFGLKFPYFPVDVHIERIAKRQGWANFHESPAEIQQQLATKIPPELLESMHILLLNLGRHYCRPQKPDCENCPIRVGCRFRG